jgi:hypothetical protein
LIQENADADAVTIHQVEFQLVNNGAQLHANSNASKHQNAEKDKS